MAAPLLKLRLSPSAVAKKPGFRSTFPRTVSPLAKAPDGDRLTSGAGNQSFKVAGIVGLKFAGERGEPWFSPFLLDLFPSHALNQNPRRLGTHDAGVGKFAGA